MQVKTNAIVTAAALICLIPAASLATLTDYFQDFEGMPLPAEDQLLGDGWLVYGNVFAPDGTWIYGYGSFPAPNNLVAAFCNIVTGEGGPEQGERQLSVYSDYENTDHDAGNLIEANVFQEQQITAADVGGIWLFQFQAKRGNIAGSSTAAAFIKTLDPGAGYAQTNFITEDMTAIPDTWNGYTLMIEIDASLEGQILQFGFTNTATDYESSGIFYDNVLFEYSSTDVPDVADAGMRLGQNYPNPFNPSTRIDFALDRPGPVAVSVYDIGGRLVATLLERDLEVGDHQVIWNGRTDAGRPAPAGQYRYVLRTATGMTSRSMVLVK